MRKIISTLIFTLMVSACVGTDKTKDAKYVFLFIGDGMGIAQVTIAESYLSHQKGKLGGESLSFTQFPVLGMSTTHSANRNITCSSASGTALSAGVKTNNGFLGVTPDSSAVRSVAYDIHDNGYKVGILSTVTLDHATPAAYYANSISRNNYYDISAQLAKSGFDFFAGGGFIAPTGKKKDQSSTYDMATKQGYTIAAGLKEYENLKGDSEKILLLQESGTESGALPYAIDQKEGDMNMSDLVSSAIDYLYNEKGFFIMAESGRIDWAGHANDAKTNIIETIDFSEAVATAYEFYLKYPDETLIIVTADHETGGMGMGSSGYSVDFDALDDITFSSDGNTNAKNYENKKANRNKANEDSGIGWTTGGHTGIMVPVFAIGANSSLFSGKMDNTDIPKKIYSSMGIK